MKVMNSMNRWMAVAVAAVLLSQAAPAQLIAPGDYEWTLFSPHARTIRIETDATGEYSVHSGTKALSGAELVRTDDGLTVLDEKGQVLAELECTHDGRIIMPPEASLTLAPKPKQRAVIGIKLAALGEALAAQLDLEPASGALVSEVTEAYPAERAGLKKHDVIVRADGRPLDESTTLTSILASKREGEQVVLTVLRGGRELEIPIPVKLEEIPTSYFSTGDGSSFLFYPEGLDKSPLLLTGAYTSAWTKAPGIPPLFGKAQAQPKKPFGDTKLSDIDQRLDRLERLLEKLVDEQ